MTQVHLTPVEHGIGDLFGSAVAVSGDTSIVGAPFRDEGSDDAGAAFVFVRNGASWSEQQRVLSSDGAQGDAFGGSVAVNGDTALVGAPLDDDKGIDSGSVYVFVRSGSTWSQQQKVLAADGSAGASFGQSVAFDGNMLVVGAPNDGANGVASGAAYVFVRNGGVWAQQQKLVAADGTAGDQFGFAVALNAGRVLVGAPQTNAPSTGAAYVFVNSGGSFSQTQKLVSQSGTPGEKFGFSVGISGGSIVIGAPENSSSGIEAGAAYVFQLNGSWMQQTKLSPSDVSTGKAFGYSVALNGTTALIGAPFDASQTPLGGAAYAFTNSNGTWSQALKFSATDGAQRDLLGASVAASNGNGVVGALFNDVQGADAGSVYALDIPVSTVAVPALGSARFALLLALLSVLVYIGLRRVRMLSEINVTRIARRLIYGSPLNRRQSYNRSAEPVP